MNSCRLPVIIFALDVFIRLESEYGMAGSNLERFLHDAAWLIRYWAEDIVNCLYYVVAFILLYLHTYVRRYMSRNIN